MSTNFFINVLGVGNSSLSLSTILAMNEMFGYVNIHSKDITKVTNRSQYSTINRSLGREKKDGGLSEIKQQGNLFNCGIKKG